jgi:Family of unknown function (DUF5994)
MNGMRGPRRTSSPVRLSLNPSLGGDIDGAWWPHSGSLASELPDLIDALHEPLGEIVDINLNWSVTAAAPILDGHFASATPTMRWKDIHQRIMVVVGRGGCARLVVIPHTTAQRFARMVLRLAATMPDFDDDHDVPGYAIASLVVRAARAQSAASATRTLASPVAETQ